MPTELAHELKMLLAEADEISDPLAGGLMDRGDCQVMVVRLTAAIRLLMKHSERREGNLAHFSTRAREGLYHPA